MRCRTGGTIPLEPADPMTARTFHPSVAARLALAACAFFFLAGQPFLPLLGVQNDEALFEGAFLNPRSGFFLQLGRSHLPIMALSYLGTLKAWLYRTVFMIFAPGAWSLREPALCMGALSIWLFFLLMRRVAGPRSAGIACGLLAVDAVYLLTSCFDWGPVVLQHLLFIGGMLLLVRFYQERRQGPLCAAFLCFGLAMWDKALAEWMLSGMCVAALALFPRKILHLVTARRAAIAGFFFALGALPLILYNARSHSDTFRGYRYDASQMPLKARILYNTARGDVLFEWLVNEDWQTPSPRHPDSALEKASFGLAELAGNPRHNLLLLVFGLALLLAPLARGTDLRVILFALVVMAVQWIQMAVTGNAGTGAHHTILLWPMPQMVIGASFASASRRWSRMGTPALAAVLAVAMVAGALQINEYYRYAWRNGGTPAWSDAVFRLAETMNKVKKGPIFCADWGIMDPLRLLDRGRLTLGYIYDAAPPGDAPPDAARIIAAIAAPDHIFVSHTPSLEYMKDAGAKIRSVAEAAGYRRHTVSLIADRFGRNIFETYRFTREP